MNVSRLRLSHGRSSAGDRNVNFDANSAEDEAAPRGGQVIHYHYDYHYEDKEVEGLLEKRAARTAGHNQEWRGTPPTRPLLALARDHPPPQRAAGHSQERPGTAATRPSALIGERPAPPAQPAPCHNDEGRGTAPSGPSARIYGGSPAPPKPAADPSRDWRGTVPTEPSAKNGEGPPHQRPQ